MNTDPAYWESLLETEGLGTLDIRDYKHIRWVPDEVDFIDRLSDAHASPWAPAPDYDEVSQYDEMMQWIPAADVEILSLVREGRTQMQIAKLYGCSQPSIGYRVKRATSRLAALAECGPIPSRDQFADVLTGLLPQRRAWTLARDYFLLLPDMWSAKPVAEEIGMTQTAASDLGLYLSQHPADCVSWRIHEVIRTIGSTVQKKPVRLSHRL